MHVKTESDQIASVCQPASTHLVTHAKVCTEYLEGRFWGPLPWLRYYSSTHSYKKNLTPPELPSYNQEKCQEMISL